MNKREKKAVERIEDSFYSDLGKGVNKFQKITLYEDGIRDVRILLNLLEKLQKENEELEEINNELEAEKNEAIRRYNFETIPIKKVKDKIEYLEDYIEENSDEQGYWGNINPDVVYGQIEILEEILKLESE